MMPLKNQPAMAEVLWFCVLRLRRDPLDELLHGRQHRRPRSSSRYGRNRQLISRSTLFVMITARKGYVSVVTAAECLPTTISNPSPPTCCSSCIERLPSTKQDRLARDRCDAGQELAQVVAACDEIIASGDRCKPTLPSAATR